MRLILSTLLITILPSLITAIDLKCSEVSQKLPTIGDTKLCSVSSTSLQPNDVVAGLTLGQESVNFTGVSFVEVTMTQVPEFSQTLSSILEHLIITSCGLRELRQSELKKLPKLKFLGLSGNDIASLESNLFKFNPNLEFINLADNEIAAIDGNAFEGLNNLRSLNLTANFCTSTRRFDNKEGVKRLIKYLQGPCGSKKAEKMSVTMIILIVCVSILAAILLCCCCCIRRRAKSIEVPLKPGEEHQESPKVEDTEPDYLKLRDCSSQKNTDQQAVPSTQHPGVNLATVSAGMSPIQHQRVKPANQVVTFSNERMKSFHDELKEVQVGSLRKSGFDKGKKPSVAPRKPTLDSETSDEVKKNKSSLSSKITQMNSRENNTNDLPDDVNGYNDGIYVDLDSKDVVKRASNPTKLSQSFSKVANFEEIYDKIPIENEYDVVPPENEYDVLTHRDDNDYIIMHSKEHDYYEEIGFNQPPNAAKPVYENVKLSLVDESKFEPEKIHYLEVEISPSSDESRYLPMDAFKIKYTSPKQ